MAFSLTRFLKGLNIRQENTQTPKEIDIIPGGSASTKTTITTSQTTNKTITLPDATDTLVGKATTDVLTNKTIDADGTGNSITNIEDADIKVGAAIDAAKLADGSVSNTEFQYINSLTSNAQTQLDANASGLANHLADTTDAHDASAISFVPAGTIAATDVQAAVEEVATEAATNLATHEADTTNIHGIVDTSVLTTDSNTQTLTNKTISGATNTITNVSLVSGVTGILPIANGGTNSNTQTVAFDNLSPMLAAGDLITRNGTGNLRLPVGNDGETLIADSSLAQGLKWGKISGIKNYIANGDAEATANGWLTYKDAAASRPVNGTGGVSTLVFSRSASSPLRGAGSFVISKPASNLQGEGVAYDFTIDIADQAKVLNISLDYLISTGTYSGGSPTTDSDLIVYVYDVTNSTLIEPVPIKLDGGVNGVNYSYAGSFQTAPDSTSYRLILHCATTAAVAYQFKFDNVVVGPATMLTGGRTIAAKYHCVGGTGTFDTTTPVNFDVKVIDTTSSVTTGAAWKFTAQEDGLYQVDVSIQSSAADSWNVYVNGVYRSFVTYTSGNLGQGSILVQMKSGDYLDVRPNGPELAGGSDTTQISIFKINTSVAAKAASGVISVAATNPSNGLSAVPAQVGGWANVDHDTSGSFDGSSGVFTAPEAGIYDISGELFVQGTYIAGSYVQITIKKNGSTYRAYQQRAGGANGYLQCCFGTDIQLNAGDLITLEVSTDATTPTYLGGSFDSLSIAKRNSGTSVSSSDIIAMTARNNIGQAFLNTTADTIIFEITSIDTHSAYNPATGEYTIPEAGLYQISGQVSWGGFGTGGYTNMYILQNGATVYTGYEPLEPSYGGATKVTGLMRCVAGDIITLQAYQASAGTHSIASDATSNFFTAIKVG